jgi:hypothetical protein
MIKKVGLSLTAGLLILLLATISAVHAAEDWKQEFAKVCGKTQNAMALSPVELKHHITRCDKLAERLDELNGPAGSEKKVYAKRLQMCRDLYVFTLEYRENEKTENNER